MRHDDIEKRLYDSLQPPSQEVVQEDCDRVLNRLRDDVPSRAHHVQIVRRISWRRFALVPAAAAVLLAVFIGLRWRQPEPPRSTVNPLPNTVMTLADGSRVEKREGADVAVENANDGLVVRLGSGSIIVHAAKQTAGRHLYVRTKDVTVSVVGTIFLVKADDSGSRVAVIEGEVRVQQNGKKEESLHPGEQTSSNEKLQALALQSEIGWSREATAYLAMLHQSLAQSIAARQDTSRGAAVPDKPHFDVESVRLCEEDFKVPVGVRGGGNNSIRMSTGRLDVVCTTVASLVRRAYRDLENNYTGAPVPRTDRGQLDMTEGVGTEDGTGVRGPEWTRSERYSISAVAQGPANAATMSGPMLLDLLERRFQLKLHVDTEEVPAWALGVAKGGLKIKPLEPGSCVVRDSSIPPFDQEAMTRYMASLTKPLCGGARVGGGNDRRISALRGFGLSMRQLADNLSLAAWKDGGFYWPLAGTLEGRRVVDKTGIPETTLFEFNLQFGADPQHYAFFQLEPLTDPQPNIFEALAKIGLTLEKTKAPREFIVIDRIERPSPN
jgi:uncharacterized protein (TIGR03435 family)